MTVASQKNRMAAYATNGSETDFDYDFETFSASDLLVFYTATGGNAQLLTLNSDYTVYINGEDGGTVTTTSALAAGELLIVRELDIVQNTDIVPGESLPAETLENQVDRLTMICLQLQEQLDRGLILPASSGTTDLDLPEPEANKILGWNSAGDGIENRTFASLSYEGSLTDLDDVTVAGAIRYDLLVHDGTIWRNEDHLEKLCINNDLGTTLLPFHVNYIQDGDTVKEVARYQRSLDSVNPSDGFGLEQTYYLDDNTGVDYQVGAIKFAWDSEAQVSASLVLAVRSNTGLLDIVKIVDNKFGLLDSNFTNYAFFNFQDAAAAGSWLTIDFGGENRSIDFSAAAAGEYLYVEGASKVSQDYTAAGTPTFTDLTLTQDLIIGDSRYIGSASDPDAIQIEADGDVVLTQKLGLGVSPAQKFEIGSTDNSDRISIYHDNTNAYMKWDDGFLQLITDEGTNTDTIIMLKGKGTGRGFLRVYDQDDSDYLGLAQYNTTGYIYTGGNAPGVLNLQHGAHSDVNIFKDASEGETQELKIYGYRAADASRNLQIGVGVDAADTASFDGVSNYYFDGNVKSTGTIDASAGKLVTRNDEAVKPTGESDGYISVYKDGAAIRFYTFINGTRYFVNLTADPEATPGVGNPFGAWLPFYYTYAA